MVVVVVLAKRSDNQYTDDTPAAAIATATMTTAANFPALAVVMAVPPASPLFQLTKYSAS